ncbi:MAG TPA: DUF885 domain-containing protein [Verrucomicrobiota bacterium]|nr:DUF885 domain-containing protein [Verrucomicrobiota bacterium]HNU51662.1 DUF885 domain-containing protein [Verrucomicrobiota bacterium]
MKHSLSNNVLPGVRPGHPPTSPSSARGRNGSRIRPQNLLRRAFCILGLATLLTGAGLEAGGATDADATLQEFFRQYQEAMFRLRPFEATRLGDHRFDNQLEDLRPEARREWTALVRQTLKDLPRQVPCRQLSRDGQVDYDIFQHELTKILWLATRTRPFEEDPRVYSEYVSDSVFLLLTQSTLPPETNIANALARMRAIPAVIAAARANLRHPPAAVLETAILQNQGAVQFYEKEILEFVGNSPQRQAVATLGTQTAALLREYQRFLEQELRPRATGDWRLGRARFHHKLELELDAGLTANQVLADAESEFSRVLSEMYVIARQLWSRYHPRTALPPADETGRRETVRAVLRAVSLEHGEGKDLVRDAQAAVDRIRTFIRQSDFLRLPDPDRCQVIEMPEFQRGNSVAYLNSAPPLDPKAPSMYAVSPPSADWPEDRVRSLLEEYNRHMLQILTIHEAYPGHYVQLEYANRAPSLIRRAIQSGPYIEGWAVYTEQTMLDQGYGEGDLALRLTQLKFYLRAVVNALLDHRMHCTRMSDQEAMTLLTEGAFQSAEEARLKIARAKQTSVQLSTYFVGRMAMVRLRQSIQNELGDRFDLGRYHEAVLGLGSVPLKHLPVLVRARLSQPR